MFLTELAEAGLVETGGWDEAPDDGGHQPARLAGAHARPGPPTRSAPRSGRPAARTSRRPPRASARRWRRTTSRRVADGGVRRTDADRARTRGTCSPTGCSPSASGCARPSGEVELPAHLSASALVRLESDPAEFAQHLRRPVPGRTVAAGPPGHPLPRVGRGLVRQRLPGGRRRAARAPTTTRRPSTWTSRRSGTRSWRPSGRTGRPSRSRWTSRSRSTATCCAPASTRCSPTPTRTAARAACAWSSSTGRRARRRRTTPRGPPASCSWPSTGSPGRAGPAPRSTGCAQRSATSVRRDRVPGAAARRGRDHRAAALGDAGAGRRRPSARSNRGPTGADRGRTRPPAAARGGRARRPRPPRRTAQPAAPTLFDAD